MEWLASLNGPSREYVFTVEQASTYRRANDCGQHRIMNNKRKYPSCMIHDNGAASKVPSCKSFDLILGYHLLRIHVAVEISGEDLNWITAEIAIGLIIHPSRKDCTRVTADGFFLIVNIYVRVNETVKKM